MKERQILFSAPMVRALLEGRKSQTRRIVKHQGIVDHPAIPGGKIIQLGGKQAWLNSQSDHPQHISKFCPYGQPGDRLWVRETWTKTTNVNEYPGWPDRPCTLVDDDPNYVVVYRADGEWEWLDNDGFLTDETHWKSSMFMPRWASRILLEITDIRVERLIDISEEDAIAEGCNQNHNGYFWAGPHKEGGLKQLTTARVAYRDVWESINGAGSWGANPFVWVISFKRVEL
jgi:hypothetical protein